MFHIVFGVLLVIESRADEVPSACYENERNLMLWDMALYAVSHARDIYRIAPKSPNSSDCADGRTERSRPYLQKLKQLILEMEEKYERDEQRTEYSSKTSHDPAFCAQKPLDCSDILKEGRSQSGVYTIWPACKRLDVYCDMETDSGGWTVIQRRGNYSKHTNFYRGWKDYKNGFGNLTRDFWLGNENVHLITNQSEYEIRFDLTDAQGNQRFAVYGTFRLGDEKSNYTLHIDEYMGNAGDSMAYHNGLKFQTKDSAVSRCARERMGAWWYDDCTDSNLNGVYQPGKNGNEGITWYRWHHMTSLAGSEMKIRRKIQVL